MGVSPKSLIVSLDMKGLDLQGSEQSCNIANGSLWSKRMKAQAKRRWQVKKQRKIGVHVKSKRPTRILMKRVARLGSRKQANGIERRVKTLKKLIPNGDSMGLDGLFKETADYILSLQMRVRAMQVMVNVLTGSDE
ncbi:transcription factor UPBEAT1 [Fagus crenata]|jgi:hypothetical protein|uniref:BHLH domain-containing protein n=1 Tax=Fagus sylvatica TaxID=28930 RepID=A0A2N9IQ45_FAGSY